ncbi:hypothetical protein B0J13DRAFT_595187 [Dactylonectria estremocensis]|uniref:Major facilitator superfamily (MFS) profile domain-containing protein n=1 Tax=Dactylonectria estremocensis TaxID=1079267 RepID=A0A9P9EWI1_9HYPO|nr:hypothetical protein B0J13DRAFT_595187 [Dactylonectria estremocensis]
MPTYGEELSQVSAHTSNVYVERLSNMLWLPRESTSSDETGARVRRGLAAEKNLTLLGCCKQYPKAIAWSLVLFLTVVMEAYDKSLISGFIALPTFRRRYGEPRLPLADSPDEQVYDISPLWQMGLQNAAVELIVKSQGLSWGVIQTLAATYAAEVVPSVVRACVLSNVNMCWLIGQLLGTGILRSLVHNTSQWSYRLPFALQWAWAAPLLYSVYFAPESPWWLVRHRRETEARQYLRHLTSNKRLDIDDTVTVMQHVNSIEQKLNYGGGSYADLFKGANRRRTEILCMVWSCQAMCGATLIGYAPYFLEQAGFESSKSFTLATGMYAMGIFGGVISWLLLSIVGRRRLYLSGLVASVLILTAGGIISVVLEGHPAMNWALGSLIILMAFTYNITIGPTCYVIVAEIPSTRLRVKTVALARVRYNMFTILNNVLAPQMLNPTAWNLAGKSCFVYAGTALLCLIWCYFRLPETKKLSYLELDMLFEKGAPTAKFKELQVRLAKTAHLSMSRVERLRNGWHGWLAYS